MRRLSKMASLSVERETPGPNPLMMLFETIVNSKRKEQDDSSQKKVKTMTGRRELIEHPKMQIFYKKIETEQCIG